VSVPNMCINEQRRDYAKRSEGDDRPFLQLIRFIKTSAYTELCLLIPNYLEK